LDEMRKFQIKSISKLKRAFAQLPLRERAA